MDKKYVVYQHVTPDGMYYFGQTNNIKQRWSGNGARYKTTSLYPYIEKFGWDNIQHIVLFKDQTKENALWIENFLIETAREDGVCINKQRSGNISKEEGYKQDCNQKYYEQNKDQILEYQQEYYEQNKDQILEYQQEYYEQNKDQILEYRQEYYEQNKDKILEQQKQYYEQNKDQILEQKKQYYEQNKEQILEKKRQYYKRKKEEQQLKEFGCLPLW